MWEAKVVVMWTVPEHPCILECPHWSVPPYFPIVHEAVVGGEARRRVDDEVTEADDESEIISVGGLLSIAGGCESKGVTLKRQLGELVSIQR